MYYFTNFKPKSKKEQIISAVLYLVFGALFIFIPGVVANSLAIFLGVLLLAIGAYKLIFTIINKISYGYASSIILIILGIVILLNQSATVSLLIILIGIGVIYLGVSRLFYSFMLKHYYKYWYVSLITGIILTVMGIILCINPFDTLSVFITILGVILLFYGIVKLISALNKKEELNDEQFNEFFNTLLHRDNETKTKKDDDNVIDADFKEKK